MNLLKKPNQTYQLETTKPKDDIMALANSRVDKAKADKSWISLESINYKKITVGIDRIFINKRDMLVNSYQGRGAVIINLRQTNNETTIIKVRIMQMAIIWPILFITAFIALIGGLLFWQTKSLTTILVILPVWLVFIGIIYLQALYNHFKLKEYTNSVLFDLGINEKLSPQTAQYPNC